MGQIDHTRLMRPLGEVWVKTASRFNTSFAFVLQLKAQLYIAWAYLKQEGTNHFGARLFMQFLFVIVLIYCWSESETDNFCDFLLRKDIKLLTLAALPTLQKLFIQAQQQSGSGEGLKKKKKETAHKNPESLARVGLRLKILDKNHLPPSPFQRKGVSSGSDTKRLQSSSCKIPLPWSAKLATKPATESRIHLSKLLSHYLKGM